jgi:hypothetical protein
VAVVYCTFRLFQLKETVCNMQCILCIPKSARTRWPQSFVAKEVLKSYPTAQPNTTCLLTHGAKKVWPRTLSGMYVLAKWPQ